VIHITVYLYLAIAKNMVAIERSELPHFT